MTHINHSNQRTGAFLAIIKSKNDVSETQLGKIFGCPNVTFSGIWLHFFNKKCGGLIREGGIIRINAVRIFITNTIASVTKAMCLSNRVLKTCFIPSIKIPMV